MNKNHTSGGKKPAQSLQSLERGFRGRFATDNKFRLYTEYCIIYALFALAVFSPMLVYGKAFLWGSDGMSQHYPTLLYTKKWVQQALTELFINHRLNVPYWDLNLGFGQDVMNSALNFRLFNFLFVFFPDSAVEAFLAFRTICSLFLCGIAFLAFARRKTTENGPALIGAMIYLFSGFSIYFAARHPFFLEMMFYLPLLLIGVEDIFEKGRSKLFIITVFISAISYFYFLYMVTLPTVIYAVFLFFDQPREKKTISSFLNVFLRCVLHYAIGLMLSAFSLFPSLIRTMNSSRMGNKSTSHFFLWDADFYSDLFRGIIGMEEIGIYGFIAFSGFTVLLISYMVFLRKKKYKNYVLQLALYFAVFVIPALAMVFSGFSGKTQRWCFVLAFWAAMSVVVVYPEIREARQSLWIKALTAVSAYMVLYILLTAVEGDTVPLSTLLIFPTLVLCMMIGTSEKLRQHRRLEIVLVLIVLCLDSTLKTYEWYAPDGENYIEQFADADLLIEQGQDNPYNALSMAYDNSVYRTDVVTSPRSQKYNQMNYGLRNNLAGISSYYSFSDDRICRYSLDLGNSQQNVTFLVLDLDQRTILNELAGVKYLATFRENKGRLPYGYERVGKQTKTLSNGSEVSEYLFRNIYALPLIYSYDSWFSKETYDELLPDLKEKSMLQGAVLEEEIDYPQTNLEFENEILLDKDEILRQLRELDTESHIEVFDDHVLVKMDSYKAEVYIDPEEADRVIGEQNSEGDTSEEEEEVELLEEEEEEEEEVQPGELALVMTNSKFVSTHYLDDYYDWLKSDPHTSKFRLKKVKDKIKNWTPVTVASVKATCGGLSDVGTLLNETHQYYFGERDLLLNIGYTTEGEKLQITFSNSGEYYFDDIYLTKEPMSRYVGRVNALNRISSDDVTIGVNTIDATLDCDEERLACIAVPYSDGWTARVNGTETKVMPCNGMYMAIMVPEGENKIHLEYSPPGQDTGNKITLITVIGCVLAAVAAALIRKRNATRR